MSSIQPQLTDSYGNKCDEVFPHYQRLAVAQAVEMIKEAKTHPDALPSLFQRVIDQFSQKRHIIAVASGTQDSHLFGSLREFQGTDVDLSYTPLVVQYIECGEKITSKLQSLFEGKIPAKGKISQKEFSEISNFNGRRTAIEAKLYTSDDLRRLGWDNNEHLDTASVIKFLQKGDITNEDVKRINQPGFPETQEDRELSQRHYNQVKQFKTRFPEYYEYSKMHYHLQTLETFYQEPEILVSKAQIDAVQKAKQQSKTIYVLAKVRYEISPGKMYCLTQYLTRSYQDGISDPVEKLAGLPVLALHQDRFLINDTLKEIDTIFQRAVLWDVTKSIESLIDDVGSITYLFAHCMPFKRGSAAIGEWLHEAIYQSHDIKIDTHSFDLKALSSPTLDVFMHEEYKTIIQGALTK